MPASGDQLVVDQADMDIPHHISHLLLEDGHLHATRWPFELRHAEDKVGLRQTVGVGAGDGLVYHICVSDVKLQRLEPSLEDGILACSSEFIDLNDVTPVGVNESEQPLHLLPVQLLGSGLVGQQDDVVLSGHPQGFGNDDTTDDSDNGKAHGASVQDEEDRPPLADVLDERPGHGPVAPERELGGREERPGEGAEVLVHRLPLLQRSRCVRVVLLEQLVHREGAQQLDDEEEGGGPE
mmetsp:Transcript_91400/g.295656  ORF Transcript_91400/g.295656 Transcript_91400/m.295656 type:complete len:238 (+) Transcript_91400:103-816(+)